MHWRTAIAALALVVVANARAAETSPTADLAEGAAIVAACRLGQDVQSESGRQLLAFALAMDPGNERALLIQARLERGQDLDPAELADGGRQFTEFVERVAARTKPRNRALLYYRVIELVDPRHEKALLELTRAKNQGVDTGFANLLRSVRGKDGGSRRPGVDAEPGSRNAFKALDEAKYQATDYSEQALFMEPMRVVNQLNQLLVPDGARLRVQSHSRPVEVVNRRDEDDVGEFYSNAFQSRTFRCRDYYGAHEDQLSGLNGRQVLQILCVLHNLGWKDEGDTVTLVDSEEATGPAAVAPTDARDLAAQAKRSQVDFLEAYRGKELLVWGLVSGVGRTSPRYVHLAGDQVRLYVGTKAAEADAAKLDDAYTAVQKAERSQRGSSSSEESGPQALLFVGRAKCDGISSGRITFRNGRDIAALRVVQARRN